MTAHSSVAALTDVPIPNHSSLESRPSASSRAAALAGDGLTMLAVVFTIPFVILLVGAPIALALQLGLWIWSLL